VKALLRTSRHTPPSRHEPRDAHHLQSSQ
jgi:hypothetical protein